MTTPEQFIAKAIKGHIQSLDSQLWEEEARLKQLQEHVEEAKAVVNALKNEIFAFCSHQGKAAVNETEIDRKLKHIWTEPDRPYLRGRAFKDDPT